MNRTFLTKLNPSLLTAILSVALVIFILIFLKPFGIYYDNINFYFFGLLSGYGVVSFFPIYFLERYHEKIYKESKIISFAIGAVITLFIASLLVWKYSHFLHVWEPQFHFPAFSYSDALLRSLAVFVIPLSIRFVFLYIKSNEPKPPLALKATIQFTSADGKDWFKVEQDNIYFITSCDNYVEIHYATDEKKISKRLIRNTISKLEEHLNESSLFRCHRSFIVNLDKVCQVEGNSKSMTLSLIGNNTEIPVSRTRISELQQKLKDKHGEYQLQ
jgi:hypothetical protein